MHICTPNICIVESTHLICKNQLNIIMNLYVFSYIKLKQNNIKDSNNCYNYNYKFIAY